jgi:hypothetical protein
MKEIVGLILIWIWLNVYVIAHLVKLFDQLRK